MKRSANLSFQAPVAKSRWSKMKQFFSNKQEDYTKSFYSQASEASDQSQIQISVADVMRRRQKDFVILVKKTIETILNQETPYLLNQMLYFFHEKLIKLKQMSNNSRASFIKIQQQSLVPNSSIENEGSWIYRHYCYFLMTNLIFEQLHNKFTST